MEKEGFKLKTDKEQETSVHPDFKMHFLRFFQNRVWDRENMGGEPKIKATFVFNDPSLLDGCPFVCKVSEDVRGGYNFFGVAYGREEDVEALKNWGQKFPEAKLFTLKGEFIEKI